MKLRVIFLKRKYIYFLSIISVILICSIVFLLSNRSEPSFNNIASNKILKTDLNGDGKDDTISVKQNDNKYKIEAKIKDNIYNIAADKNSPQIGNYSFYWPIKITLMDVSRDKVPEIFIQSSNVDNPLQHIFIWNDGKFENVFSNSNNILGFIDCKNNKTPKVISGKLDTDNIFMSYYMFLNYKFKNINYDSSKIFMGKDTILSFVKFIQTLPESKFNTPKEIFASNLVDNDLPSINKMSAENRTFIFQDAIFIENKCNKDGEVSEVKWNLNFRGVSKTNKNDIKNYSLSLLLVNDETSKDNYYFKIASLK